ncbi:MAG: hypothetical protein MJ151_04410 [Lachnospiraceae bacterium]|nr:hypothetical protein [Lachnospiraceae bacterium]
MKKKAKTKDKHKITYIIPIIIMIVLIAVIGGMLYIRSVEKRKEDDYRVREDVRSADEIRSRLGINLDMRASASIGYFIEDEDIARIEYSARGMDFTLKSASDNRKNLANLNHTWDTPILMTSICDDGSDIQVTALIAVDNPKVMKAEWYDNDLYYSMDTKNLTTREDFLQEVNYIIIKYHEEFY